jgi:hypothetical protein
MMDHMKFRVLIAIMIVGLLCVPAAQAGLPGYADVTGTMKAKGREPFLVSFNGKLYSFFQIRTDIKDANGTMLGRLGHIYMNVYNGTNWSGPVSLTPGTKDEGGHANEQPKVTEFKGKLYLTFESTDSVMKDDDAKGDYDILMRVFDGNSWTPALDQPAQVVSQRNDPLDNDTECRSVVFRDRLYLVWSQAPADAYSSNSTKAFRRLMYRSFDGTAWSDIGVAAQDTSSIYGGSEITVYRDQLYAAYMSNSSEQYDMDIFVSRFDGSSWAPPVKANPTVEGSTATRQNLNPRVAVHADRLWCTWQSADPIGKDGNDYDIMLASFDGTSWSFPEEVNRHNDRGNDVQPDVRSHEGKLYVTWTSNDTGINDGGEDFDIMLRCYDGKNWSSIEQVSPYGDNGTITGDHNPGDDNTPFLGSYAHKLYCTWITYDQALTGHSGGNPSVIVKMVRDYDTDGDGVLDAQDAFPNDASETKDSDGDGVGDNADPRPHDATIWLASQIPKTEATFPWPLVIIAILLIGVVAIVAASMGGKRAGRRGDDKEECDVPSDEGKSDKDEGNKTSGKRADDKKKADRPKATEEE